MDCFFVSRFVDLAVQASGAVGGSVPDLEQMRGVVLFYGALFFAGLGLNVFWAVRFSRDAHRWRLKINRLLWRPWNGSDVVYIVLVLALLHLFVAGLLHALQGAGWLNATEEVAVWVVAHGLALHWAALVVIFYVARRRNISWRLGFAHTRWSLRHGVVQGVLAYVAAIPFLMLYAALYHVWLQWSGHEPTLQDAIELFAGMERGFLYFYFIVLAVVIAPISEELLFRGILLPALGRRWGVGAAIAISSVLFALLHFHVPSLVPLLVLSVALSLAYIYTESIVAPIVMHMLFNSVSLVVMTAMG